MQAFESAGLSLAEFRQRSGFARQQESSRPPKRDLTDALKTVFWAFSLQIRTGLATAYALERCFEPEAFGRTVTGERFHRNKWSGYLSGRHVPKEVLSAVESKCSGANDCLKSPLWAALTAKPLTRPQLEVIALPLEPNIQALIRLRGTAPRSPHHPRMPIDRGLALALERRASLDALAAAVIMLRIANVEGETAAAFQWGRYVLRATVLLGKYLHAGGIARPLLELIEERVLPLAQHDGARPAFPPGSYAGIAHRYEQALHRIKGVPIDSMTEGQRFAIGQRILNRCYGEDYFYAFNPIRMRVNEVASSLSQRAFATPDVWLHTWALNMLEVGGHRDAPPAAVWAGEDLWAAREGTVAHSYMTWLASEQ